MSHLLGREKQCRSRNIETIGIPEWIKPGRGVLQDGSPICGLSTCIPVDGNAGANVGHRCCLYLSGR